MRNLFPVVFAVILVVVFGVLQLLLFRFLNRDWWARLWIRRAAWSLPIVGILAVAMWGYGEYTTRDWLAYPGAVVAVLAFVLEFCLILALPFSGLLHLLNWLTDKAFRKAEIEVPDTVDRKRRQVLKSAAAAIPLITLAAGAGGVVRAQGPINVHRRYITIENLPSDLVGLRILHLSDIHLRHYVTLDDLGEVLTRAAALAPDMVLVTGDVADDLKVLPDALRLIDGLKSPLGTYACLGNHEYFRGITEVRNIFDSSPIPLLVDGSVRVRRGSTPLLIGGIDDPRRMGAKEQAFYQRTIDQVMTKANSDDFIVLMSHRPDALDYASHRGIPLTLAGHTHGGQIGLGERSLFEPLWPDRYLWGHYQVGRSHLYTSAGVGHWFPYRLGCPPEAPVIELRRG